MKTLAPIEHRDSYNRGIEREINAWFAEAIFAPLQIVLREAGIPINKAYQAIPFDEFGRANAVTRAGAWRINSGTNALEDALRSGRIQYADGVFTGKFSAAITRELRTLGARYNAGAKTFRLAESAIPMDLRGILADSAQKTAAVSNQIATMLTEMQANIGAVSLGLKFGQTLDAITQDLGKQLVTTTLQLRPEDVGITPEVDVGLREKLRKDFTENTELAIKDFAKERIPALRARVEENAFKYGGRQDRLAKIIEAEFGVTKRKAEFLADQETGLLVSKYRAEKYKEVGIKDYIWSTSGDARVRPSHRVLNGKRFSFSRGAQVSPPGQPARYCNPGEDYRCRCVPRPLINLEELAS